MPPGRPYCGPPSARAGDAESSAHPMRPYRIVLSLLVVLGLALPAPAGELHWRHGLSLMGEPKYPADFRHFDYVNPDAPKGGLLRLGAQGGFDSFNIAIPRGETPDGIGLIYDNLMASSADEISTEYGLLAEGAIHPADHSAVTYRLRTGARWHDGKPVTPEDVVFSFNALKEHNPQQAFYYRHVVKAEKTGEREVTFTFDQGGNRELPQIVGQLTILPKHWWEGTDASGRKRNIAEGTLEAPLGSGPYRIKSFSAGRTISYERVPDYWGKDLPVNVGRWNFDEIRYDFYRDSTVLVEAFKGDQYDFRVENSARSWATAYDFPAARDGRVILETFPVRNLGLMQGFAFNMRRDKFKDPRVRRAFNYAFDFEEMNQALFYGQYKRIGSYFEGTELASSGLPQGKELEILETVRGQVPAEVFTKPYVNPTGGDARAVRENLREATRLLEEAGWVIRDRKLVNKQTGEAMTVEFLLSDPTFERIVLRYKANLERLGIQVTIRTVDSSQYINRVRERDFDVITQVWPQSLSPGNEQLDFWGSDAADRPGSRNVGGIKNPAVDKLIQRVIFAKDREELVAATHALDRVLLWNHYVVPEWTLAKTRTVRWNRFSYPEPLPQYSFGFPDLWWYDAAKAARTGAPQ